ncbi:histidine phosphatase family protein [Saccharopolyspora sp. WRP15-2]|uniref:Histidine phosphatase family protein n=1 Tax=Saccharopolyspora oryzae TaxID=2997343 RepID=A0ABT4V4C4_9PSEU|nr:histidine phosphatase family protein [Saccharopolyspora oryzae]MDA3628821.1 histidine phosphatase family protein [Saccharopolyspora oryzae]
MQLLLIRHGRPVRAEAASGGVDPGLTPEGALQAEQLAEFLTRPGAREIHAVHSSPMNRARETATPLAKKLGVSVVEDDGIVEFDHGAPIYIPAEEYRGDRRRQWEELLQGRWHGYEFDMDGFRRRVVESIERVAATSSHQTVAIVCHSGVINAYLAHVLGTAEPMFFTPDYTSVSRVVAAGDGYRMLRTANETTHLHWSP